MHTRARKHAYENAHTHTHIPIRTWRAPITNPCAWGPKGKMCTRKLMKVSHNMPKSMAAHLYSPFLLSGECPLISTEPDSKNTARLNPLGPVSANKMPRMHGQDHGHFILRHAFFSDHGPHQGSGVRLVEAEYIVDPPPGLARQFCEARDDTIVGAAGSIPPEWG